MELMIGYTDRLTKYWNYATAKRFEASWPKHIVEPFFVAEPTDRGVCFAWVKFGRCGKSGCPWAHLEDKKEHQKL